MQILGIEFELPSEYRVEGPSCKGERSHIDIIGPSTRDVAEALVDQAVAGGFSRLQEELNRITLERGEQTLVLVLDSGKLVVHMYDPTTLPRARFDGSAVLLSDLRFECGATSIAPLRESHLPDQHMRSGAWTLTGVSASELVDRVLDTAATSKGLKRGATFGPARGGREVWSGEAYSQVELVKVHATVQPGGVLLEIDLIDNRGREPLDQ